MSKIECKLSHTDSVTIVQLEVRFGPCPSRCASAACDAFAEGAWDKVPEIIYNLFFRSFPHLDQAFLGTLSLQVGRNKPPSQASAGDYLLREHLFSVPVFGTSPFCECDASGLSNVRGHGPNLTFRPV